VRDVARQAGVATKITFGCDNALTPPGGVRLGGMAVCETGNASKTLRELLDWAGTNGVGDLDDLSVAAPTLEDAYLRLVKEQSC
jgi:hypothetical protein